MGWGNPIAYSEVEIPEAGVKWQVTIQDETGKIPFQTLKEKDLMALFSVMMAEEDELVDEDDGEPLVDCLMDWQDKDDEDPEGDEDQPCRKRAVEPDRPELDGSRAVGTHERSGEEQYPRKHVDHQVPESRTQ